MTNTVKVTKKDVLNAIATVITEDFEVKVGDVTVTAEDVNAYIEKTIDQLNAKNEKAKARAAEKKADGDELRAKIEAILTDEYQTGDQITAALNDPEITKAKVTARLTQLVKSEKAIKTTVKVDNRKIMAYALPTAEVPVEE